VANNNPEREKDKREVSLSLILVLVALGFSAILDGLLDILFPNSPTWNGVGHVVDGLMFVAVGAIMLKTWRDSAPQANLPSS